MSIRATGPNDREAVVRPIRVGKQPPLHEVTKRRSRRQQSSITQRLQTLGSGFPVESILGEKGTTVPSPPPYIPCSLATVAAPAD